ncbi:MAG TPA: FAD-dependent oxidoreductase, partial [Ktedonobacterales bacterium]|nr:FAD-dependent oxidoreductase [Ktedonobacterales bacterium]
MELRDAEARTATRRDGWFEVTLVDGERCSARALLLATGMVDDVPQIDGAREFYGHGVHHCPYCDGWEHRDQPIVIYGRGHDAAGLALELTVWSRDLTLCSDGDAELPTKDRERLARQGIAVREERVARLEGRDGWLARVVFRGGE